MAATGGQLPDYVQRQSAIQSILGEELESAITGAVPTERALARAQQRIDELLSQML